MSTCRSALVCGLLLHFGLAQATDLTQVWQIDLPSSLNMHCHMMLPCILAVAPGRMPNKCEEPRRLLCRAYIWWSCASPSTIGQQASGSEKLAVGPARQKYTFSITQSSASADWQARQWITSSSAASCRHERTSGGLTVVEVDLRLAALPV